MSISGKCATFVVVVWALSTTIFAQNQPQPATGSASSSMVTAPPAGYVTPGGIYGTEIYLAPGATLPAQSSGISLSDRSGISLTAPFQTGITTAVPATYNWGPGAGYVVGRYGPWGYSEELGVAPETAPSVADARQAIHDLGPSYFIGAARVTQGSSPTPSLAEIAARYKAERPQNVRMYTNADAERIVSRVKIGTVSNQQTPQSAPSK